MGEPQDELTIKEAVEQYHDLSASMLARYLHNGRIKGRQIGKTWLMERESLEAYLRSPRRPGVKTGTSRRAKEAGMGNGGHFSPD